MPSLSIKEQFCLKCLESAPCSTWDACMSGLQAGVNTAHLRYEWADQPFRSLREKGLIERMGQRDQMGRSIHRITDAGRELLSSADMETW